MAKPRDRTVTKRVTRVAAAPKTGEEAGIRSTKRKPDAAATRKAEADKRRAERRTAAVKAAAARAAGQLAKGPVASAATPPATAPNKLGRPSGFQPIAPTPASQSAYTAQTNLMSIPGGYASGVITAGGTLTLQVGPTGQGSTWSVDYAQITTTTGLLDTSTCSIYISPVIPYGVYPQTVTAALSIAGGGSSIGLPGTLIYPGYFVIAVWAGGNPGDTATLTAYGTSKALTAGQLT